MNYGQASTSYRAYFNRNRVLYILHADATEGEAIARAFGEQGFMTSTASTVEGLARLVQLHSPDVVLIDLDMLVDEDRDIVGSLRSMAFGIRIFALTDDHPQAASIVRVVRMGALSVFVRPYQMTEMVLSVANELRGDLRAADKARDQMIVGGTGSLTKREAEILRRVTDGETNKEVGIALGISPRTVEVHRSSAMRKLGAKNTAQLVRIALAG
jgi:two-component system, LuxR family, response regulator FixJ